MVIGIHAVAAFKEKRTGVEEYAYRLIRYMAMLPEAKGHRFVLYTNNILELSLRGATPSLSRRSDEAISREDSELVEEDDPRQNNGIASLSLAMTGGLPENFEIRVLRSPIMWTQMRLSMEMLKKECDVLFIPAHVLPIIHPKSSVVTIHGLEYEYFPQYYSFWFRKYLRWATKYATRKAKKIITVSENTKKDLMKLYNINGGKIEVVHHGVRHTETRNQQLETNNYILYIGRIETKKNIEGIIKSFEIFKEKYKLPHKLILAGGQGFGRKRIKFQVSSSKFQEDIIETGYVNDKEREWLYRNASLFLFPSFYEGFGMPILEAQERGVPVITSNVSSIPEVGGDGAFYVDPNDCNSIADKIYNLLTDNNLRQNMINKGYENVKKFSWDKCAKETLKLITHNS